VGDNPFSAPGGDLLTDAQFAVPDDVPRLVAKHARRLGAVDAAIFLVDYEQRVLTPLPEPGGPEREAVVVEGTLAFEHDGKSEKVGPGGVIFVASGTLHTVRNVGEGVAKYCVVQVGGDTRK